MFVLFHFLSQSVLEFKSKMRTLRVRMLDGTVKTVFIDDSQPVANLMVVICTKIGKQQSSATLQSNESPMNHLGPMRSGRSSYR